jgi:hypothetical protein
MLKEKYESLNNILKRMSSDSVTEEIHLAPIHYALHGPYLNIRINPTSTGPILFIHISSKKAISFLNNYCDYQNFTSVIWRAYHIIRQLNYYLLHGDISVEYLSLSPCDSECGYMLNRFLMLMSL